ncbi:aquaporin-like protein [Pelagophyceae sp. CCMP2097]|nr:aquaporin-like protein [Pelagophyceae sp. CCMP2097]
MAPVWMLDKFMDGLMARIPLDAPTKRALIIEYGGTSMLVLAATAHGDGIFGATLASFIVAAALYVLIYVGAPISGAHYNPAVTLACRLGRCGPENLRHDWYYVGVQILAAILTAPFSTLLSGHENKLPMMRPTAMKWLQILIGECLCTFLFTGAVVYACHCVEERAMKPLIMVLPIFVIIESFKEHTGALINPALTVGLEFSSFMFYGHGRRRDYTWLIYCFAQLCGGALAGHTADKLLGHSLLFQPPGAPAPTIGRVSDEEDDDSREQRKQIQPAELV